MVSLTDPNDFAEKSEITSVLLGRLQPGSGDRYELLFREAEIDWNSNGSDTRCDVNTTERVGKRFFEFV